MSDLSDLVCELFSFSKGNGEFAELNEDIAQQFSDLLGNGVRCQEDIVLLAPLLYFSLILVEGFQTINIYERDSVGCGFVDMSSIGENADLL